MKKVTVATTTLPVSTYVAGDQPEDRISRGNQQKARTLQEEKTRWGVRLRRWKRKNMAALGLDGVNAALEAILPLTIDDVSKEDKGLRFLKYKAIRAIGQASIDELIKAAQGYRNE